LGPCAGQEQRAAEQGGADSETQVCEVHDDP
jgi:hypothetical protein